MYRQRKAREYFVDCVRQAYEKVYDEQNDVYFYYSKLHGTSQWSAPRVLLGRPLDPRVRQQSRLSAKNLIPALYQRWRRRSPDEGAKQVQSSRSKTAFVFGKERHITGAGWSEVELYVSARSSYCRLDNCSPEALIARWWPQRSRSYKDNTSSHSFTMPHALYVSPVIDVSQEEWAATKIQAAVRKRRSWKKLISMLNDVYEKEYDPDTDAWFYVNKVRLMIKHFPSAVNHSTCLN